MVGLWPSGAAISKVVKQNIMTIMKKVTILITVFILPLLTMSQEENMFEYSPKVRNRVEITNLLGNISLENTSGNSIIIKSDMNLEKPERAEGLQLLGAKEDNTGLAVNVSEEEGVVNISGISNHTCDYQYTISIPSGINVGIDYHSPYASSDLNIESYNGSLEIKTLSSNVSLKNCSGPFTVNSISGNIEVIFSNVNQKEPTSLISVSGFVDVSIPAGDKANIEISNLSGSVYNNLDLKNTGEKEGGERSTGLSTIRAKGEKSYTLNGGGQEIYLKSVSGNIYLRKK